MVVEIISKGLGVDGWDPSTRWVGFPCLSEHFHNGGMDFVVLAVVDLLGEVIDLGEE